MNDAYFNVAIYLLGFIGLASIGLIPLRSWHVINAELYNIKRTGWNISIIPIAIVSTAALWADIRVSERIFSCLTEVYCGPNIASGWIYLAVLGSIYLIFEATIALMRRCRE